MREIKFRAWISKEATENGTGEFAYEGRKSDFWMISEGGRFAVLWDSDEYIKEGLYIIEQYTGLKDKKGVDIYEGDIVKIRCSDFEQSFTYQVIYEPLWGAFVLELEREHGKGDYYCFSGNASEYPLCGEYVEVIGNIHENKDE